MKKRTRDIFKRVASKPLWRKFISFGAVVLVIYFALLGVNFFWWRAKNNGRRAAPYPPYHFSNATCGACNFAWPQLVDTYWYGLHQPPSSAIAPPSAAACRNYINIEAVGRLGNLMFEYATVVGICVKRGLDPKTCARITEALGANASSDILPLAQFKREFGVPTTCSLQFPALSSGTGSVYMEHGEKTSRVDYDEYANHVLFSSTLKGYFQSYHYFYPHADQFVRQSFAFSSDTVHKAAAFIDNIAVQADKTRAWKPKDYELVCMAVRRGDKTNRRANGIYKKWALSAEYYRRALRDMQRKYDTKKMVAVVFVGGSFHSAEDVRDRNWVDTMIRRPHSSSSVLFLDDVEIAMHPYASMKAISMCPNIIIGSSSFGWWAAYLSNHENVIAPKNLYSPEMHFVPDHYYPPAWKLLEEPKMTFSWYKERGNLLATAAPAAATTTQLLPDLVPLGSDLTTVVSSYYKIPSKYNHSTTYEVWLANFMSMNFKCVIFVDFTTHRDLEAKWPTTSRRKYIVREIADFECALGGRVNWTAHEKLDPELHVGHNALLYQLWGEKVFMVAHVVELNPFQTETFAWTDIGAFRDPSRLVSLKGYPDPTKFDTNKVTFPQIQHFTSCEIENLDRVDRRFLTKVRIGGGHFAGSGTAMLQFRQLYKSILQELYDENVFVGKDQSLFSFLILRHPVLFDTVKPTWCPKQYDIWFCIQYHWSAGGESVTTFTLPPTSLLYSKAVASFDREQALSSSATVSENRQECKAILLILSTSQSSRYRMAVREGWINSLLSLYPRFHFQYKFILGRDDEQERRKGTMHYIQEELDNFQDIEVLPFLDTYLNLTTKVALMLKWAVKTSPECRYIFKVDEDVVLRPRAFAHFVSSILPSTGELLYGGHVYDQKKRISEPSRNPENKNSLSVESFPFMFSPYAAGPMYFLSSSLVKILPYGISRVDVPQPQELATITELVPDFYWRARHCPLYTLEDAFFGHMIWNINKTANIRVAHVKNWFPITAPTSQHPRLLALWGIKHPDTIRRLSRVQEDFKCVSDHALIRVFRDL